MNIIFKIAWRNVWRHPRRTMVLMASIAVGVFGYLGASAFNRGFLDQMVESTINLQGGHITISARGFHENPSVARYIANPGEVEGVLRSIPAVDYAPLVSLSGMINSAEASAGVVIQGVDPRREQKVTVIASTVVAGEYLHAQGPENEIVIGQELAEKLHVRPGEKVVLMTSDLEKNINSGAYRIAGVFQTVSPDFDKAFVYIHKKAAQELAGYKDQISSFTLKLQKPSELALVAQRLQSRLQTQRYEVLTWKDRNRLLELSLKFYDFVNVIVLLILFTVIAFSIANAFLMVIYERIYEFGVMMANGVLPKKIRQILYFESLFITLVGSFIGYVITIAVLLYLHKVGVNLADFAKGLGKLGVGAILYPEVNWWDIVLGSIVINTIVLISVIYPAHKASRFEVVDAMRFE